MSHDGESGSPVKVDDVRVPPAPKEDIDRLIEYLQSDYLEQRTHFQEVLVQARSLSNKADVIDLGYECLAFRVELDPWLAICGQQLDEARGNRLNVAHDQRAQDKRKASVGVIKAEADQFIAPLKRAREELGSMQDLLSKTLSWCQSQQKILSADEYGDLFSASNKVPEKRFESAPGAGESLKRMKNL